MPEAKQPATQRLAQPTSKPAEAIGSPPQSPVSAEPGPVYQQAKTSSRTPWLAGLDSSLGGHGTSARPLVQHVRFCILSLRVASLFPHWAGTRHMTPWCTSASCLRSWPHQPVSGHQPWDNMVPTASHAGTWPLPPVASSHCTRQGLAINWAEGQAHLTVYPQ